MPHVMSKNKRMVLYDRNTNVKCCPRPSPPTPFPPPSCFARPSVRLPRCISPDYSLFCPVFLSLSSPVSHCLSVSLCACLLHHSGLTYITPGHQFCIWLMHYDAWIFYGGKVPSGAVSLKTHMHAHMHTLAHTHSYAKHKSEPWQLLRRHKPPQQQHTRAAPRSIQRQTNMEKDSAVWAATIIFCTDTGCSEQRNKWNG